MTLLPPPQYDVPPPVPVIEHILGADELWAVCERFNGSPGPRGSGVLHGCSTAWEAKDGRRVKCELYFLAGEPAEEHLRTRRHELGHCNGWPRDHPGGKEAR